MKNDDDLAVADDGLTPADDDLTPVTDDLTPIDDDASTPSPVEQPRDPGASNASDAGFRLQQEGEAGLVFEPSDSTDTYAISDGTTPPAEYESSYDAQEGSGGDAPRIEAPESDADVYGLAEPEPTPQAPPVSEIAPKVVALKNAKKAKKKRSFKEKFFGKTNDAFEPSPEEDISIETLRARRERAMMEEEAQERPKIERTPLPERPFWDDILKPFAKPSCAARLLMVAGAAVIPLLCATLFFSKIISNDVAKQMELDDVQMLTAFFRGLWHDRLIFLLFCFLWGVFSVPVSFQVFIDTANGADEIEDWPEYSFVGGLMDFLWLATLILLAGIPGAAFFSFFGFNHVVGLTLSATLLTPIFYLSCMQADARFTLLTKETLVSLKRNAKSWLIFTGISFAFLFGTMAISLAAIRCSIVTSNGESPAVISFSRAFVISLVLSLIFSFIPALYLRFLGRLAWIIEDDAHKRDEENRREEDAIYEEDE